MRPTLSVSAVIGVSAVLLSAAAGHCQQMSRPTINQAVMQRSMMQQATVQRAAMQRAVMQRAAMQRAVMQRAVMQRATMGGMMSGFTGMTPAPWGVAPAAPFGGWGGGFGAPGYGGFVWDPYSFGATPASSGFPSSGTPVSSYVP